MQQLDREAEFRENMERAVDEFFPKGASEHRSGALMLYASSVLEHERIMCLVRKHFAHLLGETREKSQGNPRYTEALDFYHSITRTRHY
jgi:hypothetical protein